jgi:hypothetical protein
MSQSEQLDAKHLATLLKHKHFYDLFKATGELVAFTIEIQNELLEVMHSKDPYYQYNGRCGACVGAFLTNVYNRFNEQLHT